MISDIWLFKFTWNDWHSGYTQIKAQFLRRHTCSLAWGSPQPCVSDWWSPRTSPPRFLLWWWREFRTLKESRIRATPFFTYEPENRNGGSFRVEAVSALPVVSLSDFCQSRMTNEGQPSTVTTVRLDGGMRGGLVTFRSLASSSGK